MSSIVPNTVFRTIAAAKAQGIDISKMLNFFGVDVEEALKKLTTDPGTTK
jgi:hypothetical protein